jgi:hypothetical protein
MKLGMIVGVVAGLGMALVGSEGCGEGGSTPSSSLGFPTQASGLDTVQIQSSTPTGTAANWTSAFAFNGTPIAAGDTLWFSSVIKVSGVGSSPAHVIISSSSIQFTANNVSYSLPVPDGVLTIDPSATTATTQFDSTGKWQTTVPASFSGSSFLTGLAYAVTANLPGRLDPVWLGTFSSDTPGLSVSAQWGAAVYSQFGAGYGALQVKPVDDSHLTSWADSARPGTPEAYKANVIGGATGAGGSNFTGGLSAPVSVSAAVDKCSDLVACPAPDACHTQPVCQPATGTCTNPSAPDGTSCPIANATASCQGGTCAVTACNTGYADCNGSLADGCETPTTTLSNCGGCGVSCTAGPNSTVVCGAGGCGLSCAAGFADCDGNAANGCEVNTNTDVNNCGGCGQACSAGNGNACTPGDSCQAGTCEGAPAPCLNPSLSKCVASGEGYQCVQCVTSADCPSTTQLEFEPESFDSATGPDFTEPVPVFVSVPGVCVANVCQ